MVWPKGVDIEAYTDWLNIPGLECISKSNDLVALNIHSSKTVLRVFSNADVERLFSNRVLVKTAK